jgi:hypothetical protein
MKYISKYSNGKHVSCAQYITEIICENKAKKEKKDLHYRFWTNKEWSAYYRNQIATANQLLLKYDEQAIIRAIKAKEAEKIYSLRAPHLIPIIEKEEKALALENKNLSKEFNRSENKVYNTKNLKNKSILSKLKELE